MPLQATLKCCRWEAFEWFEWLLCAMRLPVCVADRSRDDIFHRGLPFRSIKTDASFRQQFALTPVGSGLGRLCPESRARKSHETAMATPTTAGKHLMLAEQGMVDKSIRQDVDGCVACSW